MSLRTIIKEKLTASQKKRLRNLLNDLRSIGHGNDLTALATIYGTDKWGIHYYTPRYASHFRKFRYKRIRLLEIGVGGYEEPQGGGQSLRMWKRYFPLGRIFSVDIYDKSALEERRVRIFKGSQVDRDFLERVVRETGPLHFIIDDGSHRNEHVIETFKLLFPALRDGGIYVVEDAETSYWSSYGGGSPGAGGMHTTMNFFKRLADGINFREFPEPGYQPDYYEGNVTSVHFYHNLIVVYKGVNDERSVRELGLHEGT